MERGDAGVAAGHSWTYNFIDFAHCWKCLKLKKFLNLIVCPQTKWGGKTSLMSSHSANELYN
jgi:hypothetical protein